MDPRRRRRRRPAHRRGAGARAVGPVAANFRRPALALGAHIAGNQFGGLQAGTTRARLVVFGCTAAVAGFGVAAARSTGNRIARLIAARGSASPAASLRIAVLLIGYVITLAAVLDLLALPVHYFVGGTVVAVRGAHRIFPA